MICYHLICQDLLGILFLKSVFVCIVPSTAVCRYHFRKEGHVYLQKHKIACRCEEPIVNTSYIWGCYHTITNHAKYVCRGTTPTVYFKSSVMICRSLCFYDTYG